MFFESDCLERLDLRPIHSHQKETGHESSKDLRKDIVRHFLPRETLPDSETERYSRVEMASGRGSAGDDGECDTNRKSPADLENGAKG